MTGKREKQQWNCRTLQLSGFGSKQSSIDLEVGGSKVSECYNGNRVAA